jgi:hypothetical protein
MQRQMLISRRIVFNLFVIRYLKVVVWTTVIEVYFRE